MGPVGLFYPLSWSLLAYLTFYWILLSVYLSFVLFTLPIPCLPCTDFPAIYFNFGHFKLLPSRSHFMLAPGKLLLYEGLSVGSDFCFFSNLSFVYLFLCYSPSVVFVVVSLSPPPLSVRLGCGALCVYLKYNFTSRDVDQSINMIYSVQIGWYRQVPSGTWSSFGNHLFYSEILAFKFQNLTVM